MPPTAPRYPRQCFHPETLCERLSLSAAAPQATSKAHGVRRREQGIISIGELECWSIGVLLLVELPQHSMTPPLHHSMCSSDHLVCSRQSVRRDRQADLFRRLEIDHKLELGRLLHGKIGG